MGLFLGLVPVGEPVVKKLYFPFSLNFFYTLFIIIIFVNLIVLSYPGFLTFSKRCEHDYGHKNYNNFLGFEPVALVPFEPKLIDYKLLSNAHIDWLNHYNNLIRTKVGSELKKQGKANALKWMESRIKPVAPKKKKGM